MIGLASRISIREREGRSLSLPLRSAAHGAHQLAVLLLLFWWESLLGNNQGGLCGITFALQTVQTNTRPQYLASTWHSDTPPLIPLSNDEGIIIIIYIGHAFSHESRRWLTYLPAHTYKANPNARARDVCLVCIILFLSPPQALQHLLELLDGFFCVHLQSKQSPRAVQARHFGHPPT